VFSTAALAKKLDLVNIGAAGTFVARRSVTAAELAREIPFTLDVAIRPAAEVLKLVDAGPPKTPTGTLVYVSVLVGPSKAAPRLPQEFPPGKAWGLRIVEKRGPYVLAVRRLDVQRGLDVSAIVEKAFGARSTTRGWPTFERIAKALRSLE
jgi:hypothetical protein